MVELLGFHYISIFPGKGPKFYLV